MKEIAVTATNGKHDNEIIGGALIPLKVSTKSEVKNDLSIGRQ